jgi:cation diffusion facilitator CzcD-associated flavoprotein CzcO
MRTVTDCLIIGAGPYGLSLAAHLSALNVDFRIAGTPMGAWVSTMPDGMCLKSEGFASSLFEPSGTFTLGAFCASEGIPYAHTGVPVQKATFVAYGQAFQRQFVPSLEARTAVLVTRQGNGFTTRFADGGSITSRRVVSAVGVERYAQVPAPLQALPAALCSHSSQHSSFAEFAGQAVVVIGGGSSAMDAAAALRRQGARVTVVARRSTVRFQTPLGQRSLRDKIRAPMTVLGPGWKSVLCTRAPLLFHYMPDEFRTKVVTRYLGPAPAWFVREQVEGHIPIITDTTVVAAEAQDGGTQLTLRTHDGATSTLVADHVVCATGFKIAMDRTPFLDRELVAAIAHVDGAPKLSRNFETTVRGLHVIGPAAANSFGPMLRFAAGAGFASRRLSRHIASVQASRPRRRHAPVSAEARVVDA